VAVRANLGFTTFSFEAPAMTKKHMDSFLSPSWRNCTMFALRCLTFSVSLAVGLLLTAPLGVAADEDLGAKQVALKKGDRIIFFGDSLTALAGKEEPKNYVTKGYVRIVRETLQAIHKGKDLEVDRVATGGHTVPDLLKRVDQDVIAKKPTIVVIQIGVPDALRYNRDQFKTGLEELIERLQKANVLLVVCSCTSLGEKHDGTNSIDGRLDELAEVARTVAREQKVPLNDLRKAFVEHWKKNNAANAASGILTYDGNHFNDAGHRFVAEQMLKKFKYAEAENLELPDAGSKPSVGSCEEVSRSTLLAVLILGPDLQPECPLLAEVFPSCPGGSRRLA
jgi:lysophospholipase L1-like esterase